MDRPPASKRPRLSMACNICRQRKVKCDAEYPKCRNCRVRNQVCITTDPQRPGCSGVREWLEAPENQPQNPTAEQDSPITRPGRTQCAVQITENTRKHPHADSQTGIVNEDLSVRQQFDTSVNTEQGTNRTKILGGSSSQCLAKSLDLYFKAARMKPVSGFFRYGMRHAEELDLALGLLISDLPEPDKRERHFSLYRSRIHALYPIFDLDALHSNIQQLGSVANIKELGREDIPSLVSVYLVMSIGVDEATQSPTEEGRRYLHAAASLLAHVITIPYLPAVQALLLFTIAYRGHNKEGLAWQMLGMAIRIAYTLGLHRSTSANRPLPGEQYLHTRVWAACCCFEKMMHLESGRPTLISDDLMAVPNTLTTEYRFLQWHLGLAGYQGNISEHLYKYPAGRRSVQQILLDTASLDRDLLSWANQIPAELRPGNDITCSADDFHIIAFLSIEYHATMIALHRAALVAPKAKIEEEVMKHIPDDPSRFRLADGESVCVNSGRAIAKLSIELVERGANSCIIPAGLSILACITLAIYLMKHPGSRLQAMDLQLLKACLEHSGTQMERCNNDPRFIQGLAVIYEQTHARLEAYAASKTGINQQPNLKSPLRLGDGFTATSSTVGIDDRKRQSYSQLPNHLPTPSSYESTTPVPALQGLREVGRHVNATNHVAITSTDRDSSFTHQNSLTNSSNRLPQQISSDRLGFISDDPGAMELAGRTEDFLEGFTNTGDMTNDLDQMFPFEGFNVEDLWNWMLVFDSPKTTESA
ncbi:hypothetical protein PHISCL_05181 [Aspergillus sclerotialis]|uniref:Zn(2)-C6 fungal-type domain-containing protein n=1 Tax=Aspergillus sclerotialis TaxID=2070753 RepID=A0A3A2ZWX2_9EURO|nr:hypothetical protein PHISCL_05181 [Aspergillus sclerotialis]